MENNRGKLQMANPSQVSPHMQACLCRGMQATFTHTQTKKEKNYSLGDVSLYINEILQLLQGRAKIDITYVDNKSLDFAEL